MRQKIESSFVVVDCICCFLNVMSSHKYWTYDVDCGWMAFLREQIYIYKWIITEHVWMTQFDWRFSFHVLASRPWFLVLLCWMQQRKKMKENCFNIVPSMDDDSSFQFDSIKLGHCISFLIECFFICILFVYLDELIFSHNIYIIVYYFFIIIISFYFISFKIDWWISHDIISWNNINNRNLIKSISIQVKTVSHLKLMSQIGNLTDFWNQMNGCASYYIQIDTLTHKQT